VPTVDDAVKHLTDPANVTRMRSSGPQERFAVKQNRVLRGLREDGAGKAEARELALQALEKVEGGVEVHTGRGSQTGRGDREVEDWWVPADAVRFQG
jgi:hypothetical protein